MFRPGPSRSLRHVRGRLHRRIRGHLLLRDPRRPEVLCHLLEAFLITPFLMGWLCDSQLHNLPVNVQQLLAPLVIGADERLAA